MSTGDLFKAFMENWIYWIIPHQMHKSHPGLFIKGTTTKLI